MPAPNVPVSSFYDSLAPRYDVVYGDWQSSIARQADALVSIVSRSAERSRSTSWMRPLAWARRPSAWPPAAGH